MTTSILNLDQALGLKFDRSEWRMYKFSDLVENIVEKVTPKKSGLEHYIGLKHLDSGSLHIERFGRTSEIEGDKLKICAGDLIFAKRNSYLKRVAIAKFDAVASAHSLVLRTKEEAVIPEFLPFFLLSEVFWRRAIEISVGSLSPTINWRVLAKQEFLLPPKDQQSEMAKLFWSIDNVVVERKKCVTEIDILISTCMKDHFQKNSQECIALGNTGTWVSGGTPSKKNMEFWGGDIPWVSPKDMKKEMIDSSIDNITQLAVDKGASLLPNKSILVVVRGMILAHSFPVAINTLPVAFNQDMRALLVSEEFIPEYLLYYLQYMKSSILTRVTTTTHGTKRLASEDLFSTPVPKPSFEIQSKFVELINTHRHAKQMTMESVEASISLQQSLINQVF